jgi:NDP-sugar pyrophosphorylase family protein
MAAGVSSRMKTKGPGDGKVDPELSREADEKAKSMIGVGRHGRPFIDYVIANARNAGYRDIVVVIGERDSSIRDHLDVGGDDGPAAGLDVSFAVQPIPEGRTRPLGTADALLRALESRPDWRGQRFTVCNSDNLYSVKAMRTLLESEHPNALIDYDREALRFDDRRIARFAVTRKDEDGFLIDIVEKPNVREIETARAAGAVGVSKNIFRLSYDMILPILQAVPVDPTRQEKELPFAVKMMATEHPKSVFAYPFSEHVPDLTSKEDIAIVRRYLEEEIEDDKI